MKLCLLSGNVNNFFKINPNIISKLSKQYDGVDLINYGQQKFEELNGFNVRNIQDLRGIFKYFSENDVVCIVGMNDRPSEWLKYFILRVTKTKLIRITNISTAYKAKFNDKKFVLKIKQKIIFLLYMSLIYLKILPKIDLYLTSNFKDHWSNKYKYKKIRFINSVHCDEILDDLNPTVEEYIVFLDSNLPFHQDQSNYGFKEINPEKYYGQLNIALDNISEIFSKPIMVCLHPKFNARLSGKYFPGKETSQIDTLKYSKKAFLTVFHESSSINYSILLKKPIIQLSSNDFNAMIVSSIDTYNESLGLKSFNMNDFPLNKEDCNRLLSVDCDKYNKFSNENLCRYSSKRSSMEGLNL